MGIDLEAGGRNKRKTRTSTRSEDPYLRLLVRLYRFLSRRTDSRFNQVVLKRMYMSRTNRAPISLSRLVRYMGKEDVAAGKIAVIVGKVLDDERKLTIPSGLRVCALGVSESTRARIVAAGGEVLTFDQLALVAPKGENTVLLRGRRHQRACYKHFAGVVGATNVRPYVRAKGRKFERARGRRKSRGFKI